ncbi:carboxypeptidase-like regulatory domain-containing protein [Aquimarina sp. U1-2]|uniref:carboxypeptidase-like regulatory domain-containing protein n=1 Tax=Aquimarina sp. U1-2 TaxID=2823141 RepID=UPI001AECBAAA|nr:carboxypeptidase-like regulatory domain-containing protein [Aquimarina sp. U1-2]MBP2832146.1 carboxypeptidase-like regulatory domain-containing protein [Aquimarina sp. U1-2]
MKIKFSTLIFCFVLTICNAQITSRVMIDGKISAPIGDDVEGVVVYNRSTDKGTITNSDGRFKLSVGVNDRLEVVAMQYQHFIVLVDKGIIDSKKLNIFLNESVNQLDEVVVTPYDLNGNVTVDVQKIGFKESGLGEVAGQTSVVINDTDYDFRPDELSPVTNTVFLEDRMINGLNFVNLFKVVFKDKDEAKKKNHASDIDVRVRNMYKDDFFKNYLALDIDQINDFIFFAENNGLSTTYFETGKELDLLQFLVVQSKLYKQQQ